MAAVGARREVGLLLLLSALWGTAFMFVSLGLRTFTPVLFTAVRFDFAAAFLFLVVLVRRPARWRPVGGRAWIHVVMAAVLLIALHNAVFAWGQRRTTAGVASVIAGLMPIATLVFARAFAAKERVGARGLAGLAVGFAGILVLSGLKPGALLDARGLGELAIVASVLVWAVGSVLVERRGQTMDLVAFAAWQSTFGALLLHALAFALEDGGQYAVTWSGLAALVYLAAVATGIGLVLFFRLAHRIGALRVNLWAYLAPVFATTAGFLALDEPFEWRAALALLLIATGFAIVISDPRTPEPAPPTDVPGDASGPKPLS